MSLTAKRTLDELEPVSRSQSSKYLAFIQEQAEHGKWVEVEVGGDAKIESVRQTLRSVGKLHGYTVATAFRVVEEGQQVLYIRVEESDGAVKQKPGPKTVTKAAPKPTSRAKAAQAANAAVVEVEEDEDEGEEATPEPTPAAGRKRRSRAAEA